MLDLTDQPTEAPEADMFGDVYVKNWKDPATMADAGDILAWAQYADDEGTGFPGFVATIDQVAYVEDDDLDSLARRVYHGPRETRDIKSVAGKIADKVNAARRSGRR